MAFANTTLFNFHNITEIASSSSGLLAMTSLRGSLPALPLNMTDKATEAISNYLSDLSNATLIYLL
jgi:hypothetical protein